MYVCQVIDYPVSMKAAQTTTRQRNARGDGELLRGQLLDAAASLLEEHGDAARLSVRAIARTAGVSPTALYLHFPDRDALVEAAVDRGFSTFDTALIEATALHADPIERLFAMGTAYLDFARDRPALYATLFTARRPLVGGTVDRSPEVDRDDAFDALVDLVAAVDPEAALERAFCLWGALHGYATLHGRRGPTDWPDPVRFVATLLPIIAPTGVPPR